MWKSFALGLWEQMFEAKTSCCELLKCLSLIQSNCKSNISGDKESNERIVCFVSVLVICRSLENTGFKVLSPSVQVSEKSQSHADNLAHREVGRVWEVIVKFRVLTQNEYFLELSSSRYISNIHCRIMRFFYFCSDNDYFYIFGH
jgi:hypothetical protein